MVGVFHIVRCLGVPDFCRLCDSTHILVVNFPIRQGLMLFLGVSYLFLVMWVVGVCAVFVGLWPPSSWLYSLSLIPSPPYVSLVLPMYKKFGMLFAWLLVLFSHNGCTGHLCVVFLLATHEGMLDFFLGIDC